MKNIRSLWDETVKKYGPLTALKWLNRKETEEITYEKLGENVKRIRRGLEVSGFAGAHIALIGGSSLYWIESYLALVTGCNVAVPLDVLLPVNELADLLVRSDCEALFLDEKLLTYAETFLEKCPLLKKIWILSGNEIQEEDKIIESLSELLGRGEVMFDVPGAQGSDIATIIFTSGTTGKSKGVMLTQENLSENVRSVEYEASPGCVVLSVLPIHHAFCLVMDILKTLSLGCCVCLNDSLLHMVRNMGIFKPEVMLMVPLMIETIYKKIAALEKDLDKQSIYEAVLGGKLRIIFTGGAHLEPFYIDKFEELGVDVLEGYGMSECSPVITSNNPAEHKKGSIGKPLKNVEIAFKDGEILVRGSSVMKGYYKLPEETAAALEDGWLHTGDKGYIDEDGYLFINGRVKNLIIMSNGENVSPEEIENKLGINPLIKEVVITGENNGLTARIFPDPDVVESLDLSHEELKLMLHQIIDEYNASQPSYRHVTALLIRKDPFARNTTGKIIRKAVGLPESELTG